MALHVKTGEVPKNAVILTRSEAVSYQWDQIMNWKPALDVWPYTHGLGFLGGIAALSGIFINLKFRKSMKFGSVGGFATLMTTSICPGITASVLQMRFVSEKTFLPSKTCPLCLELRSIGVQNACAIVYPIILVPVSNFMIALRAQTHRIPYYKNWKDLLLYCKYLYKPIVPAIILCSAVNSVAASFILRQQISCLSYMHNVLTLESEDKENAQLNNLF